MRTVCLIKRACLLIIRFEALSYHLKNFSLMINRQWEISTSWRELSVVSSLRRNSTRLMKAAISDWLKRVGKFFGLVRPNEVSFGWNMAEPSGFGRDAGEKYGVIFGIHVSILFGQWD